VRPEELRDGDLDDDLALEIAACIEVEVCVRVAGEAINTRVCAASKGVHRPVERQVVARHLVERRLRPDLVEVDAEGLWRLEGPDPLDVEAGQTFPLLPIDSL